MIAAENDRKTWLCKSSNREIATVWHTQT